MGSRSGTTPQQAFGSSTFVGGTQGIGGTSVVPAPDCAPQLNLLSVNLGANGNWIGGTASSSIDNPCGVQGLIYIFGDTGFDNTPGTADDTCPYLDQSVSPCSNGRCCVKGTTYRWPTDPSQGIPGPYDYNAPIWGCGIGISLNDPGTGSGTLPYAGPAKGFTVKLSGNLQGQTIRIGYTQLATPSPAPFLQYPSISIERSVGFTDVLCPTWSNIPACVIPGPHPHALQVWVAGGDVQDDFELCIDAVHPIL